MTGADRQPPIAILSTGPCEWVRELLSRCMTHIDVFSDAWELRRALLAESRSVRRVLVGNVGRPSPINAAAAVAKDGSALSVTLVADEVTGSLRSRAYQAGITNVMTGDEVLRALLPGRGPQVSSPDAESASGSGRSPFAEVASRTPNSPGVAASVGAVAAPPALEAMAPGEGWDAPATMATAPEPAMASDDGRAQMAPKVVLISGRGGVGKSAICALMAALAASWGLDVAIVDLDLGFGNLFSYFGLEGPADLTRLGSSEGVTQLGLCGRRAAERITLFGPCAKPEYAETVAPKVTDMLDALALAHDLVVVDGGTSWGDGVAQSVQAGDRILVCTDERSGAVGSLARAGSLVVRLGVARTRIHTLVNRCDPRHRDEGFLDRAAGAFRAAGTIHIEDGGIEVGEVMSVGRAVDLVGVSNPFVESVARCLGTMLSELGILPDDERALRAVGARRGSRPSPSTAGRWAA